MKRIVKINCVFLFAALAAFAQTTGSVPDSKAKPEKAIHKASTEKTDANFFKSMENIDALVNAKDIQITMFKLTIAHVKEESSEFHSASNLLTAPMKEALKNLKSDDRIYFEYINGKDKNGAVVRLDPLNYIIK